MEEKTQEEIMKEIEMLDTEYNRFVETTLKDIISMIVEEDYPISVAIGGLTATIDSMLKTYDLNDLRPSCIEILEHSFTDIDS